MLAVFIVFLCLSVGLSRPLSLERGLKSPERCKRVHQKAPASTSWEDGHRASLTRIIARIDSPNISAGKAGWHAAVAGFIQVVMLMWLRTMINYQYKHGGSMTDTFRALYAEGGIARFYDGFTFAAVQGPLARFGSIAANEYAMAAMRLLAPERMALATGFGSLLAALWRLFLMPIDTCKTVAQVGGRTALREVLSGARKGHLSRFYAGAGATMLSTAVAHYPWFVTYNLLQHYLSVPETRLRRIARDALVGFSASTVSDIVANPVRVLKTMKQADAISGNGKVLSYRDSIAVIQSSSEGILGLLHRGLLARMTTNGVQSILFCILLGMQHTK